MKKWTTKLITILLSCSMLMMSSCVNYNLFQGNSSKKVNDPELFDWGYEDTTADDLNYSDTVGLDAAVLEERKEKRLSSEVKHILKYDDKLSISIWNHDELSMGSIFGIYNSNEVYGKWQTIDYEGKVKLPKIGQVHLGGLSIQEAEDLLAKELSEYILDPIVVVKVLNREITILGEVKEPGNFNLDKEHNTLTEMIGKSGGFNFYADTKKVKIVRGEANEKKEYLVDFTRLDPIQATQILLQPGDVIYIPSQKSKNIVQKSPTLIPFTSAITTLIVVLSFNKGN